MSLARNVVFGLAVAMAATGMSRAQSTDTAAAPTAQPTPPRAQMAESVAAVVNDEVITSYDMRQRILLLLVTSGVQATPENIAEIQKEALRSLVDEHLQMQEIRHIEEKQKDLHIMPTAKELDDEIKEMASANNVKPEQLLNTLKSAGVQPDTLREQLRVQMAWRHYMGGRFGSAIHIGDEQIAAAEARILAASEKPQYLVSEIFIDAARVGGAQQAEQGAEQLIQQIKQGAPFAAVARQFSARATAANGGDEGWLTAGEIQPAAIEPVLEAMRPGQLSAPIPTADGVYILALRDKRAGVGAVLVDIKQAAVRLPADATPEQSAAAEAKLETLKTRFTGCGDLETEAAKLDGVVAGDLGETEVSDLSPDFRNVLTTLKVGQIGGPVRTKEGLHLVALCGKRASGPKAPSRDDLENRLYGEQLTAVAKRFLRDLQTSATIETR